jgi:ribosomal protein S18 acetylase RimI-like enzyme
MTNERWAARTANAPFIIAAARSGEDLDVARELFRQYGRTPDVSVCVVGFDEEIQALPGPYAEPHGTILLARIAGEAVGCVAVKPVGGEAAEMKRLFVRPEARGKKLGDALASAAIEAARTRGYRRLRLDTLPSMTAARAVYARLGFGEIAPWVETPVPGVAYLELAL